ncbi:MAG TPA: Rsd/AlgQ family anti-sigma factor [Gammaproteobacteria bacterium]|nr:Rsd/AlgQ family anti-sigma factor [Gammaproteobacteria bacterium]
MQTSQASVERRYAAQTKHDTLLGSRTATLSLYTQLAALRPFKRDQGIQLIIQEFCEALVDYTASAHFQLYRFIDDGTERRQNVLKLSEDVYPKIANTTQQILDFNEKYDFDDQCDDLDSLDADLSRLGEILADRILYEDQVIAALTIDR